MFRCSSAASCFLGLFCSVYHFVCLSVFCVAFCSSARARAHHPQCVPSIPRRLLSLLCRPPYVPCRRFYPCASYIQPHTHPLRPRLQLAVPRPPPFVPPSLSPPLTTVSCIFRSVYLPLLPLFLGRALRVLVPQPVAPCSLRASARVRARAVPRSWVTPRTLGIWSGSVRFTSWRSFRSRSSLCSLRAACCDSRSIYRRVSPSVTKSLRYIQLVLCAPLRYDRGNRLAEAFAAESSLTGGTGALGLG